MSKMIQHHPVDELQVIVGDGLVPGSIVRHIASGVRIEVACTGRGTIISVLQSDIPPDIMVATVMWHEPPTWVYLQALPIGFLPSPLLDAAILN